MTVANQLRLAIGALIAVLIAILAAAFYVPHELNESANEKYVRQAIPLRSAVENLVVDMATAEAAANSYLVTKAPRQLARYQDAIDAANEDLTAITPYARQDPRLEELRQQAIGAMSDLLGTLTRLVTSAPRPQPEGEVARRVAEANQQFRRFEQTWSEMLAETEAFVRQAERDQDNTYRQLLIILGVLGTIALAIGGLLLFLVPRRLGQVYGAEQRARAEAESRAEASRALSHVSDGVILTDSAGFVRYWNPAAARLTQVEASAAGGRRLWELLPAWDGLIAQAHDGGGAAAVLPLQVAGGERWVSIMSVDFGEGVVYALRDVTEEHALESMRSEFVATASHELRTPMTSIAGAGRTLLRLDDELPDERRRAFLQMIVTESDRLSRIVDQILLASRLDAGRVEVTHEECDAAAIARAVLEANQHRASEAVTLVLDAPEGLHHVDCDPDRLRQVLFNIIDNAIKYSPDGGEVRVELAELGGMMRFTVRDQGIGFSPADADSIFERFRRLGPHLTRGVGGTGLGLYISRELVERMGGRIWADSRPGAGSAFFFELPLAREPVPAV
jgi:two-component system, OmpR family, phosphate regulon sensor histidine kinase PhoR